MAMGGSALWDSEEPLEVRGAQLHLSEVLRPPQTHTHTHRFQYPQFSLSVGVPRMESLQIMKSYLG